MRILLIAYEYPPIESAHGLRWGYLASELALRGHEVQVLSARLGLDDGEEFRSPRINLTRCFAGPYVGLANWVASSLPRSRGATATSPGQAGLVTRVYQGLRRCLDQLWVPDVRSEWLPFAWRTLCRLVHDFRPELLIASHEPGVDLALAWRASRRFGLPWLADLGDPMLSPYAPRWRRPLEAWLERRWLATAGHLTVTTESARQTLLERLQRTESSVHVLPQGFDPTPPNHASAIEFDSDRLELVYTGTLYGAFRDPAPLLEALAVEPRARLTFAGSLHGVAHERLASHPQVRNLGRLPHAQVRALQRQADVLVNFGNLQDLQVPGKLFEYFGAGRPVLHISQSETDPVTPLVMVRRRGLVARAKVDAVSASLLQLAGLKACGGLQGAFDLDPRAVSDYSWPALAEKLDELCAGLIADGR